MPRPSTHSTAVPIVPVIVVAPGASAAEAEGPVGELKSLLEGLNFVVTHTVLQRHAPKGAASIVGEGKLQEIKALVAEVEVDWDETPFLAFASEISPSQQRVLERDLETVVLDRTAVILRVFESRARTRLSKLEIELARLIYSMPRVRDDKALDDREGGGGRGGRGNSNVELTKQQFRNRTAEIRREIETQQGLRRTREKRREEAPRVALVGYTNAGKSSWMRALTGSEVLVEDKLFATLETTVRALHPPTIPRILVSDTVGFIQDLPHALVASFRSTLDEALETDLLLHVVDAADARWREHFEVTREVLAEVGATEIPLRVVFNKLDLVTPEQRAELEAEFPEAFFASAHDTDDATALHARLVEFFEQDMGEHVLEVPFSELGKLHELRNQARVVSEEYTEAGIRLTLRTNRQTLERFGFAERKPVEKEAWEAS